MAGDWLKLEFATAEKPEVWEIANKTGLDPDAVLGKLFRVWVWFSEQSENGNVASVTPETLTKRIETLTGAQGFATAMREVGWLNGTSIPNFDRHNGKSAKTRALTYSRVKRFRNARETNVTLQRQSTENREEVPSGTNVPSGSRSTSIPISKGGKVQEGGAPLIEDPVVEKIPLVDGSEFEVRQSLVAELDRAYPAVEPVQTLRELRAWNVANPQYRKTKAGATRHINAWFAKEQNRASARQGQGGR